MLYGEVKILAIYRGLNVKKLSWKLDLCKFHKQFLA